MTDEHSLRKNGSGSDCPILEPDSPDLDFGSFREHFATFANSLSLRFNILVDNPPPVHHLLDIINYAALGVMNANQRRVHELILSEHNEYTQTEKRGQRP